jgi:hypothetical protein
MQRFFAEPVVRLFLRALLAAGIAFATKYVDKSGNIANNQAALSAALVGAGLAFAEVFTPLNQLVGVFKGAGAQPVADAPPDPIEPPGDTTEPPK